MKCIAHNIQYSPFTFGWKIGVADNLSIDPHLGVFASYDYTSKMKESGESISWEILQIIWKWITIISMPV